MKKETVDYHYDLLGVYIREARKRIGMNQEKLAKEMGISRATLLQWEKGRTKIYLHHFIKALL